MKHHPLAAMLIAAADGHFPPSDGTWRRLPPWRPGIGAVAAFTGSGIVAVDDGVGDEELDALRLDGYGRVHDPRIILALAEPAGWIDCLDHLFVIRARGRRREDLVPRPDLATHSRVGYAQARRDDVQVFGRDDLSSRTVVTVGIGTAGLHEVSFELDPTEQGLGRGAALVEDAVALIPAGEVAVVAAAPGNAACIRSILKAGLLPVGSIQLFQRPGPSDSSI